MTDGAPPAHPYLASILAATIGIDPTDPDQRPLALARRLALGEDLGLIARDLGTTLAWARWDIDNETPWTVAEILTALKRTRAQAGPIQGLPGGSADSGADRDDFDPSLPTMPDQMDDTYGTIRVVEAGTPWRRPLKQEASRRNQTSPVKGLDDLAQRVSDWSEANPSVPPEEGAKALACDIETFRRLLGRRRLSWHEDYAPVPAQLFEGTEIMLQGPPLEPLIEKIMEQSKDSSHRPLVMARAYAFGRTLDEIGQAYGVTRERARQIINQMTPWSTSEIGEARKRQSDNQEAWHRDRVAEWSRRNLGASLSDGAEDLGYNEDEFRRLLGSRRRFHERRSDVGVSSARRSDDEILDDLRKFHAETGESTSAAFGRWAREAGVPGPQTAMHRFGSWNQATTRAGIKDAAPVDRERRYHDDDLWAAVIEGIEAGHDSANRMEHWLASQEGMPSMALIRARLRLSWREIRTVAFEIVARRSERDPEWVERVTSPRDWPTFLDGQDPMVHMRAARLALGQNITTVKFREWARATGRPGPLAMQRRTGKTWMELVAAVGGVPNPPRRSFYTDAELLAWLRVYPESDPEGPYPGYEEWRQDLEGPSAQTISRTFGGWESARERARGDLEVDD